MTGNVKKQFVAKSVICTEKLTIVVKVNLFKTNKYLFISLIKIIQGETSLDIVSQMR